VEPFGDLELKYVDEAEVEVVLASNVTDIIISDDQRPRKDKMI